MTDRTAKETEALPILKKRVAVSDLEHVYNELKRSIMMGEFVPGQKLKLTELAEAFGTSHMPVREALNRLAVVNALITEPRRSPVIPAVDKKRLRDLLSLRIDLECNAARRALELDDDRLADRLSEINEKMTREGIKRNPNFRRYLELNHCFHFELYGGCENPDLLMVIELLWLRYGPLLNLISTGGTLAFEHSQHTQMIEAIRARDCDALCMALKRDLSHAACAIETAIDNAGNA